MIFFSPNYCSLYVRKLRRVISFFLFSVSGSGVNEEYCKGTNMTGDHQDFPEKKNSPNKKESTYGV